MFKRTGDQTADKSASPAAEDDSAPARAGLRPSPCSRTMQRALARASGTWGGYQASRPFRAGTSDTPGATSTISAWASLARRLSGFRRAK